jgi:alkyl hydroperoxide reductase subunit D
MNERNAENATSGIEALFAGRDSAVSRDLKLNLKKLLDDGALGRDEAALVLLAVATAVGAASLAQAARTTLQALDLTATQIQEAAESAAIMAMLNKYYRLRHMLETAHGSDAVNANYRATGLRMNSLAKPELGKPRFELLAFAVSVVNGCEKCVAAHEKELLGHGVSYDKIHDAARLAAVVPAVQTLLGISGSVADPS